MYFKSNTRTCFDVLIYTPFSFLGVFLVAVKPLQMRVLRIGGAVACWSLLPIIEEKETMLFSRYSRPILWLGRGGDDGGGGGGGGVSPGGPEMERLRIGGWPCLAWPPAKPLCLYIQLTDDHPVLSVSVSSPSLTLISVSICCCSPPLLLPLISFAELHPHLHIHQPFSPSRESKNHLSPSFSRSSYF